MRLKNGFKITLILLIFGSSCNPNSKFEVGGKQVSPVNQWDTLIIGTWKYEIDTDKVYEKFRINGDIEYSSDGTFIRTVTIKGYSSSSGIGEVEVYKGGELLVAGGTIKGNWYVDEENQILIEAESKCDLYSTKSMLELKDFDSCKWLNDTMFIGDYSSRYYKNYLLSLNESEIRYNAKYFASDLTLEYKAFKQK